MLHLLSELVRLRMKRDAKISECKRSRLMSDP